MSVTPHLQEQTPETVLREQFGLSEFRPLQREAIEAVLNGQDTFVLLPTGGGKSLCFQIPALILPKCTMVVSPLISLMSDQVKAISHKSSDLTAATLNSSMKESERRNVLEQLYFGKLKLLYLAPETLLSPLGLQLLQEKYISLIAIDEAHCISQWGHDFRPEYGKLSIVRQYLPNTPIIALTATADETTRKDIIERLDLRNPTELIGDFDRPNLTLTVRRGYKKDEKIRAIQQHIEAHERGSTGIIYCTKRDDTETLASKLNKMGFRAMPYHAGLPARSRDLVHQMFVGDQIDVICATVAFGMGIDKSNVRWVIHYNMPRNIESYYQEIGRAGRDGKPASTILFYSYGDIFILDKLLEEGGRTELNQQKMEYMKRFCESSICRRRILLSYFGQEAHHNCGNCDVCLSPQTDLFDATIILQKALSTIIRAGEKISIDTTVEILRGSRRYEILNRGYHHLSTYGIGLDLSYREWKDYIFQMVQLGLLRIDYSQGYSLQVTPSGRIALRGEEPTMLHRVEVHPFTTTKKSSNQRKTRK